MFFVDDEVRRRTKFNAIVTVADAKHLLGEIDRAPEAQEQLALADVVLLNKTDLVSAQELANVGARITDRYRPLCGDNCNCGQAHMPDPNVAGGKMDWRKAWTVLASTAFRPCTGALIVLVFSISQRLRELRFCPRC
jgi:ABC-type nickel/cobalt efflux system permease component RcnA